MAFLPLVALLAIGDTTSHTVRSFVDAFNARDAAAMTRQVTGRAEGRFPFDPSFPTVRITLGREAVTGSEATVEADIVLEDPKGPTERSHESVRLQSVGGDWRIVPVDPRLRTGREPRQIIGTLAMLATNPRLMTQAKTASKSTVGLSHVKQIGLATIMYAADHKNRLPTTDGFKAAIMPYLRNADVFTAPDDPKGTVSYFLDPRLSGRSLDAVSRPADTAMILQGHAGRTVFPYSGRTAVGYADGHAKLVKPDAVAKARTVGL